MSSNQRKEIAATQAQDDDSTSEMLEVTVKVELPLPPEQPAENAEDRRGILKVASMQY